MTQLDESTRQALCAGDQPPPGVEDRILASILGPVGGGPGPDGGGAAPSSGGVGAAGQSTLAYVVKVVGATLGLAAGGVALVAVTAAGVRSIDDAPARERSVAVERASPSASERTVVAAIEPRELEQPEALEPAPAEAPMLAEAAPARPVASSKPSKPVARDDPKPKPGVEAELALMQQAREAKQPKAALVLLDQHRKEFADGVFAAEREVLRVESLCALGRSAEAGELASAFVERYPSNPLRSRVEPACKK